MRWFKLTQNTDERKRVSQIFRQLHRAVRDKTGVKELLASLLEPAGVPAFFTAMFDSRGSGGTFYGRSWDAISDRWIKHKRRKGWDERIGHRIGNLRASLTQPGSTYNIHQVFATRATFGSRVRDPESMPKWYKYAMKFNDVRPVIDAQTMIDIRSYLTVGDGAGKFNAAVSAFKLALAKKAVVGMRKNRYGNVFPQ